MLFDVPVFRTGMLEPCFSLLEHRERLLGRFFFVVAEVAHQETTSEHGKPLEEDETAVAAWKLGAEISVSARCSSMRALHLWHIPC